MISAITHNALFALSVKVQSKINLLKNNSNFIIKNVLQKQFWENVYFVKMKYLIVFHT